MVSGPPDRQLQHPRHRLYPLQRHRANLAKGFSLPQAVQRAKDYVSQALAAMLDLGQGSGPLHHGFALSGTWAQEAPPPVR